MTDRFQTADFLQPRLVVAEAAARAAGLLLVAHYAALDRLAVEQKGVNDFVSNADKEAEAVILMALQEAFPNDAVLGEETGRTGAADAPVVWCVDPLDGTSNFLKGAHNWCVSIGLWAGGAPVLGVIFDPLRGEMFTAAAGLGARCNGALMATSTVTALDRASFGFGYNRRIPLPDFARDTTLLLATGAGFRQLGAGALMLAYVAAGRVDAYYEQFMWAWDAMAGLALIAEAGGQFVPYPAGGAALEDGGLVLATNAGLLRPIQSILSPG